MIILLRRKKHGLESCKGIQAQATTAPFTILRNDKVWPKDVSIVFRWGCTSHAPAGITAVNSGSAIRWCNEKRQARLDMQAAGVSVPQTWTSEEFTLLHSLSNTMPGKYVLRPPKHEQGKLLSHGTIENIMEDIDLSDYAGGYVSKLIDKVAEYRVAVVSNRVAWVASKTPGNPEDVAWNVSQGGRFDNVKWSEWPMKVVKEALAAAKVSGADFCAVDIMVDADGKPYVLELNSAPGLTSEYRQRSFAKCFEYIAEHGKEHLPDIKWSPRTSWKSTLHPSLKPE